MDNNNQVSSTSELQVRREKLAALCEAGKNPFEITKYDFTHTSASAVAEFTEKEAALAEGEELPVKVAGRIVSRRIMGKASFAHLLDGTGKISFVIGSSHGLAESVKRDCHLRLSFSKMTFPHQLMKVILAEAVYRSFTIIAGKRYHK